MAGAAVFGKGCRRQKFDDARRSSSTRQVDYATAGHTREAVLQRAGVDTQMCACVHPGPEAIPEPEHLLALYRHWRVVQRCEESCHQPGADAPSNSPSDPCQLTDEQQGNLLQLLYFRRLTQQLHYQAQQQQQQQAQQDQKLGGNQHWQSTLAIGSKRSAGGGGKGQGKRPAEAGVSGAQNSIYASAIAGGVDDGEGGEEDSICLVGGGVCSPRSPCCASSSSRTALSLSWRC